MTLLAVVISMFGAEGISPFLEGKYRGLTATEMGQTVNQTKIMMGRIDRATLCQLTHGLAMIAVGILITLRPRRMLLAAEWCFLSGTVLYSGSLFASVATGQEWLTFTSQLGGIILLLGWLALVEGSCQGSKGSANKAAKQH